MSSDAIVFEPINRDAKKLNDVREVSDLLAMPSQCGGSLKPRFLALQRECSREASEHYFEVTLANDPGAAHRVLPYHETWSAYLATSSSNILATFAVVSSV